MTEVDKETIQKKPRCGTTDIHQSHKRKKRYYLGPSKWNKNPVTWNFDHKYGRHYYETDTIRTIIHSAVSQWQQHIPLQIIEVAANVDADIRISFEKQYHLNVDPYYFDDSDGVILAHAFQPLEGLGGDIHFREEVGWNFDYWDDIEHQSDGRYSFYATALHELGHSLGLDHSDDDNAVMYGSYTDSMGSLSYDDIAGIQHIYGYTGAVDEEIPQKFPDNLDTPHRCNTSYDAVALLRDELFIFKDTFMWRAYDDYNSAIKINQMWPQLPEDLRNVDAVYENRDGKIMTFVGVQIFIFEATTFEYRIALKDLGIHSSVRKIDAIFNWAFNGQTYIFSGNDYWLFDEKTYRVQADYPKRIDGTWRDVYNIDTAFTYNDRLYFFKGINYYEFDDRSMQMKRMKPYVSAYFWMKCSVDSSFTRTRLDAGSERNGDFIKLVSEEGDIVENIERFVHPVAGEELTGGEASCNPSTSKLIAIILIAPLLYFLD